MQGIGRNAKLYLTEPTLAALEAMERGQPLVVLLLAHGASLAPSSENAASALVHAINIGYLPFARARLAAGADPNVPEATTRSASSRA